MGCCGVFIFVGSDALDRRTDRTNDRILPLKKMKTDNEDRIMVSFTSGLVGGIAGGIGCFLLMNLVGRILVAHAREQQVGQFQDDYR